MTTTFWHGFADMHLIKDAEIVVRDADGVWLDTTDGRRLLDATAALWYCAVGYGRASIADAVADQLRRVAAYSSFGAYTTDTTLTLADRLAALAPFEGAKVFLGSGGSDYPIALLKEAGVDMTTDEPLELTIRRMNEVMDEMEKLLASTPAAGR